MTEIGLENQEPLGTKITCDGLAVLVEMEKMAENFTSLEKKEIALDLAWYWELGSSGKGVSASADNTRWDLPTVHL